MKWISVDPGESVGYAVWEDEDLVVASTADMREFPYAVASGVHLNEAMLGVPELRHVYHVPQDQELWDRCAGWEKLVIEDWLLYPKEMPGLAWDKCRTARLIGQLEFIARFTGHEYVLQPALIKGEARASGAESLFLSPRHENRHANDAIMHGWVHVNDPLRVREPTHALDV